MIKCLKYSLKKNFIAVLKSSSPSSQNNDNSFNILSFTKKSSRIKTVKQECRTYIESLGIALSDYQYKIYLEMIQSRDISIKLNNDLGENIIFKQFISTVMLKEFHNMKTHTIIIAVI